MLAIKENYGMGLGREGEREIYLKSRMHLFFDYKQCEAENGKCQSFMIL